MGNIPVIMWWTQPVRKGVGSEFSAVVPGTAATITRVRRIEATTVRTTVTTTTVSGARFRSQGS